MMEYKGYIATIEYDDSVGLLHGQVVNAGPYPIVPLYSRPADVEGLEREFRISVEEYLASCVEDGVEPRKPLLRQAHAAARAGTASARGGLSDTGAA